MDELSLMASGIENKIKKLIVKYRQIKDKITQVERENRSLQDELSAEKQRVRALEQRLADLDAAGTLVSGDSSLARKKVVELLRDIEKCQALLSR